jgi:hypothetical protein
MAAESAVVDTGGMTAPGTAVIRQWARDNGLAVGDRPPVATTPDRIRQRGSFSARGGHPGPLFLDAEVADLDSRRTALVAEVAPKLLGAFGVGAHTAATLLVTVGDNPERLRNEETFARLCGVAPIPTGSGKTEGYHRLQKRAVDDLRSIITVPCVPSRRAPTPVI